jgi:major type 1 subunit fimbrin (pilin)
MKSKFATICLGASFPLLAMSEAAWAADGTISFTGSLVSATCVVKVNNTSANGTVGLPAISSANLASSGGVAGATIFSLDLSGCTTGKTINAYFEAGPTVDAVTGNLTNGGTAGNVQVQLLTASGVPIAIGRSGQATSTGIVTSVGVTSGTLNYIAQYYATGVSTSGSVTTSVTYSLTYI